MNPCPTGVVLRRLLDESLEGPELAAIEIHVEVCPQCQQDLEDLTRGHGRKSTIREGPDDEDSDGGAAVQSSAEPEGGPGADDCGAVRLERATVDLGPAGERTALLTDDRQAADPDQRPSECGPPPGTPNPESSRSATDWPSVRGYLVVERLGEGGMGVVYKARHLGLNRPVALKMIRGGSQARPDHFRRFSIEAEAVAKLRHPNILQIYDIGEANGLPYVALELLDGGGLDLRLAGTPMPGRSAAELLVILARAVDFAHQAGIIHRDLKPSNVLYASDGVPKITDFGLAKRIDSDDHQTESGQIMGSPSYMAPEQARGHSRDVGPAADIYALGAILYEMLTGRPPFKGETPMETVRQVIDDEPVPPSRLVPRVARDLETICLKCLHKEPHKRFESAEALARDLGATCAASRSRPAPLPSGNAQRNGPAAGRPPPLGSLRPPQPQPACSALSWPTIGTTATRSRTSRHVASNLPVRSSRRRRR